MVRSKNANRPRNSNERGAFAPYSRLRAAELVNSHDFVRYLRIETLLKLFCGLTGFLRKEIEIC